MPNNFLLPRLPKPLPYKVYSAATFFTVLNLALIPSSAFSSDRTLLPLGNDARNMPAYYEDLCVAQIDHGNDGDEWLDALDDCRQLALRLKQLEETVVSSRATEPKKNSTRR